MIGIAAGSHLASKWIRRRQSVVFLSFHHSREPEAEAIGKELADLNVRIERIPFQHSPDHDTLLTSIEGAIQRCDLVACFPGDTPSFVENEVLAATAQNKPLLLIVDPLRAPRLPNTAKKGYPVFDSSLIDGEGKRTLAICNYSAP